MCCAQVVSRFSSAWALSLTKISQQIIFQAASQRATAVLSSRLLIPLLTMWAAVFAEGAAIIAHENTHKHLLVAQRVEDWDYFPLFPPWRRSPPKCSPPTLRSTCILLTLPCTLSIHFPL